MIKVFVTCEVRPTEDVEKVKKAVENMFTWSRITIEERDRLKYILAEGEGHECLEKLHSLLRRHRILDAARSNLKKWVRGNTATFHLNKQAAYMGSPSFCLPKRESPLGPITFQVACDNLDALINWLAPRTSRGAPIAEYKPPN